MKGQCPFTCLTFSIAAQFEKVIKCLYGILVKSLGSPSFMVGGTLPEAGASEYAFPGWSLGTRRTAKDSPYRSRSIFLDCVKAPVSSR